jgi:hypothetical protein
LNSEFHPVEGNAAEPNPFISNETNQRRIIVPVILVPVLWMSGAAVLLGGGWYFIAHMH